MEIKSVAEADRLRITVTGSINAVGAEELDSYLKGVDVASTKQIVFDFRSVDYIGSAGIGVLLLFYKRVALQGGRIAIENIRKDLYHMIADGMNLGRAFTLSHA